MKNGAVEVFLLDVDGTLVDSNDAHACSWVDALREFGRSACLLRVRLMIGMGTDKVLPLLTGLSSESEEGKAVDERRAAIFRDRYLAGIRPIPGVRDLLEELQLRRIRPFIASSADRDMLDALLGAAGAPELGRDAAMSDDAEESKPAPDIVEAALARAGVSAEDALLIGDTPYDLESAHRARVDFVGVRSGGWHDEALSGALAIFENVGEIAAHLDGPILGPIMKSRPMTGQGPD